MAGLSPMIKGLLAITLLSMSLIFFMTGFLYANNTQAPVLQNPAINQSINQLNASITSITDKANQAEQQLGGAKPLPLQFAFLIAEAFFYIPLLFLEVFKTGMVTILTVLFPALIGNSQISGQLSPLFLVFNVIGLSMLITIVFLIIKFVRTGESER